MQIKEIYIFCSDRTLTQLRMAIDSRTQESCFDIPLFYTGRLFRERKCVAIGQSLFINSVQPFDKSVSLPSTNPPPLILEFADYHFERSFEQKK